MTELFILCLQLSLVGTVMTVAVIGLRALLGQRMSPHVLSALWLLVLLRLCLPVTLESPIQLADMPSAPPAVQAGASASPSVAEAPHIIADAGTAESATEIDIMNPHSTAPAAQRGPSERAAGSSWQTVLAVLWLAGALFVLANAVFKAERFRRRYVRTEALAGGAIAAAVDGHRRSLHIRRHIPVRISPSLAAPVVFGWLRPCILLPQSLTESMPWERQDCVLLHEICHVRRRDILLSHIWLLAKALHWFNPFVWLAYRMMADDAELCCDRLVSSRLTRYGQIEYTQSLIDTFRMLRHESPVPASAALCVRQSQLDRRVRGILTPARRSVPALVTAALLALVLAAAGFTSACGMTASAADAPMPANGEKWREDIPADDGHILARIDALVTLPDADAFPVMAVSAAPFTQQQVDELAAYFAKGQPLIFSDTPTSAELKERIAECEAALESGRLGGQTVASIRDMIEEYKTLLAMKPRIEVVTDSSLKPNPLWPGGRLHAVTGADDSGEITAAAGGSGSLFTYDIVDDNDMLAPLPNGAPTGGSLNLTGEEAARQTDELLDALGISGYQTTSVQRGAACDIWGNEEQGWIVTCAQTAEGIPIRYASVGDYIRLELDERTGMPTDPDTGESVKTVPILSNGSISIQFDDNGLRAFGWYNPLEAGAAKDQGAPMMDFAEIKRIFAQQIKDAYTDTDAMRGMICNVTGVELAYATIPQDDGAFALIPAWIFSGCFVDTNGSTYAPDTNDPVLMALSATDGTLLGCAYFE